MDPQDVHHLFDCTAHPNDMSPMNLWDKPVEKVWELSFLDPGNLDLQMGMVEEGIQQPVQMTSPSHTQARVQPRNIYNHTYIKFLPGQNNLILNPDKTYCTLFTPDPAEYTSNLNMATHPKVLGLTLDPKLTYSTQMHNISVHAHTPLQIIKVLTATGWGKQKETLMATYKAVMRPALKYASSIWLPLASSTSINKL